MPTKQCVICRDYKIAECFNKNLARKDGKSNVCRDCNKKSSKAYYARNRRHHIQVIRKRKDAVIRENRQKLMTVLQAGQCADCGEKDVVVLDFDHVRGKKRACVTKLLVEGHCWQTIEEEVAKCDIRCANCHRRKTTKEQCSWRQTSGIVVKRQS